MAIMPSLARNLTMSSPWLAVSRTTTDVLTVISATSGALSNGAEAVSELAAVGLVHARAYRVATQRDIAQDEAQRFERRRQTLAISDATFYRDVNKQLAADPELQSLYNASLLKYPSA